MSECTETLLTQKLENNYYSKNERLYNFTEEKELIVTITLDEYRDLVKTKGIHTFELEKERDQTREIKSKCTALEKKLYECKEELRRYQNKYGILPKEEGDDGNE